MSKQITLLAAAFILLMGATATKAMATEFVYDFNIFDLVQSYVASDTAQKISFSGADGASMPIFGEDITGGILQFYVQPTTGTDVDYGTSPEALNAIEPSAGIQFKIDLGL